MPTSVTGLELCGKAEGLKQGVHINSSPDDCSQAGQAVGCLSFLSPPVCPVFSKQPCLWKSPPFSDLFCSFHSRSCLSIWTSSCPPPQFCFTYFSNKYYICLPYMNHMEVQTCLQFTALRAFDTYERKYSPTSSIVPIFYLYFFIHSYIF